MLKRTLLSFGALLYGWALASGCAEKAAEPAPAAVVSREGITADNVTYDNYIGLLINTRCKTCHNPASEYSTKPALDAWVNEKTYANAASHGIKIVGSINENTMPVSRPLVAEEKALLLAWLNRGMPQR